MTATAMALQLSATDGLHHQQLIVFPHATIYRRVINPSGTTQWRPGTPSELASWSQGFVKLAETGAPVALSLNVGPTLLEVTDDELESARTVFPGEVGRRWSAVLDAVATDPSIKPPVPSSDDIETWINDWLTADGSGNTAWLDPRILPAARITAPAPAPAATVVEPDPEPEPDPNPYGWVYPPISADGYVVRPNGERYKVRDMFGKTDVERMREARLHGHHVFLWGDPGTGKTALLEAAFGTEMVTMLGTEDTDRSDFVGNFVPTGSEATPYRWDDGAQAESMERGVPLFVDEGGVISPKTMTTLFSVMDGRGELRVTENPARGTITAKPGFFVCLATNPHAPGVRLSEALTSRFDLSIEVTTDFRMMRELGVSDELVTAAENLRTRQVAGEAVWVPQARELLRAKTQLSLYGPDVAHRNLVASCPEDMRSDLIEALHRTLGGSKLRWLTL